MLQIIRIALPAALLLAAPAAAAVKGPATGIGGFQPVVLFFTVAAALLLTLLFREPARQLANKLSKTVHDETIRRAMDRYSLKFEKNVILDGIYGGLSRCDYVLLAAGGVFCVRVVAKGGEIHGDLNDAQWRRIENGKPRLFLNPVIQNEGRARALQNAMPGVPVHSLIVFPSRTTFAATRIDNVIGLDEAERYIDKFAFPPSTIKNWDDEWMNFKAVIHDDAVTAKDYAAQINFG